MLLFKCRDTADTRTDNNTAAIKIDSLLVIKMPFQDKIFTVEAKVVHCTKKLKENLFSIGVCFQRFDEAFKVRLIEQIYLISEYRDLQSTKRGKDVSFQDASREWIRRYSKKFQEIYW